MASHKVHHAGVSIRCCSTVLGKWLGDRAAKPDCAALPHQGALFQNPRSQSRAGRLLHLDLRMTAGGRSSEARLWSRFGVKKVPKMDPKLAKK